MSIANSTANNNTTDQKITQGVYLTLFNFDHSYNLIHGAYGQAKSAILARQKVPRFVYSAPV